MNGFNALGNACCVPTRAEAMSARCVTITSYLSLHKGVFCYHACKPVRTSLCHRPLALEYLSWHYHATPTDFFSVLKAPESVRRVLGEAPRFFREERVRAGAVLFKEHTASNRVYFIGSGSAELQVGGFWCRNVCIQNTRLLYACVHLRSAMSGRCDENRNSLLWKKRGEWLNSCDMRDMSTPTFIPSTFCGELRRCQARVGCIS